MPSEACIEELETLSAIFLSDIHIQDELPDDKALVSMVLYPATADDEESRYVTLTLELGMCKDYPTVPPSIVFRNPRGLSDTMLDELLTSMKMRCEERLGSQMIYELIDMSKEFLTKNNRPASECPICLLSFTEFDVFHRTKCFHYFHSHCLGNYLLNLKASFKEDSEVLKQKHELTCPVCRDCLEEDIDVDKLLESPPPTEEPELSSGCVRHVLQEWEGQKEALKQLFEKQKSQGGIIDLNENVKLLVISGPATRENNEAAVPARSGAQIVTRSAAASANLSNASVRQVTRHDTAGGGVPRTTRKNTYDRPTSSDAKSNDEDGGTREKVVNGDARGEDQRGRKKKITEYFAPRRTSNRKTQEMIREEKHQLVIKLILEGVEDGLQVKRFPGKGRGVIASKRFQKNEFVVEYAGDLLSASEAREKDAKYAREGYTGCYMYYFTYNNQQYCVDATEETGRLGRLINHSRNGNLITKVVEVKGIPRLIFIAKRDIEVGEELNYDYGDRSKESLRHHPWLAY